MQPLNYTTEVMFATAGIIGDNKKREKAFYGGYTMTQLLNKAFEKANQLPETEQNALGQWLIEEIIAEKKWQKSFAESENELSRMAGEALEEYERGDTAPLDSNQL